MNFMKRYLILEDGTTFAGQAFGDLTKEVSGEVVFNTGMTGYQEAITDPSYTNQLITFTYPLIGNYGIDQNRSQSLKATCTAVIVHQLAEQSFHYTSQENLDDFLKAQQIPGISGIDTRALTKHLRQHGTMTGILSNQAQVVNFTKATQQTLTEKEPAYQTKYYSTNTTKHHVVLIDFGVKQAIINNLLAHDCSVDVVPYTSDFATIANLNPDGILLSNGPADPTDYADSLPLIQQLQTHYPLAGICLGHQLFALANGATTYQLSYGHRGLNHPVKNLITGKTIMTSQNHGYAVAADSLATTPLQVTQIEGNDGSIEGLKHETLPAISVQYHPEANPGPSDGNLFFNQFNQLMTEGVLQHA